MNKALIIATICTLVIIGFSSCKPENRNNTYEITLESTRSTNLFSIVTDEFTFYTYCGSDYYQRFESNGISNKQIFVSANDTAEITITIKRNRKIVFEETASGNNPTIEFRDSI